MRHDDIQKMIDDGVGLILASCDSLLRPEIVDAEALELAADGKSLKVYGLAQKLEATLQNIKANPRVAVTIGRPSDNAAVQFKGLVQAVRKTTEQEVQRAKDLFDRYRKEIILVGVLPKVAMALDSRVDTVLEITISEVFHQTPGVRAGQSIDWKPR